MATSGSTSVAFTNWDTLRFDWSTTSQSVVNNTSTIAWTLKLISADYGQIRSTTQKAWKVKINSMTYSGTTSVAIGNNSTRIIASDTAVIAHNNDGTGSFTYSFDQVFNITFASTDITTVTGFGVGTLDTIPRASTMSVPTMTIGSPGTITITSASSSFKHTITAKLGSYSSTVATLTSASSVSFTPPSTWSQALPNSTSGLATYTITTYTSDGKTIIGSKNYNATVKIASSTAPQINSVSYAEADSAIKTQFGSYIVGKTKLNFSIVCSGVGGADIKSITTTLNGKSYSGSTFTTDALQSTSQIVSITVVDTRGRSIVEYYTINATDYSSPTINQLTVDRANSDGTLNDEGSALSIQYGFNIDPVNNKNLKFYKVEIKSSTASSYSVVASGYSYAENKTLLVSNNISTDESYLVKLTLSDYFHTENNVITKEIDAPTAFTLIDFNKSGKGLAVGKVSQREDAFECAIDMYDKFDTKIRNGVATRETDANTSLEEVFISNKNTPGEAYDYYFVRQIFSGNKTLTGSRVQIAIPQDFNYSEYRRQYDGVSWSEWQEYPVIVESGTSGIWTYKRWSNFRVELTGKIPINSISINTALGGWYRSDSIAGNLYPYPISLYSVDNITMQFITTNNNGGIIWATSSGSTSDPPFCYIIRPTSATGVSGEIHIRVEGTL